MGRNTLTIIGLAVGASLLLGDLPLRAAVPSFMPQTTKQTVLLNARSPKKAAKGKKCGTVKKKRHRSKAAPKTVRDAKPDSSLPSE